MLKRRLSRNRKAPVINTGSMADIAFLLLIFFLVTSHLSDDQGIAVQLPPLEENTSTVTVEARNLCSLYIDSLGNATVNEKAVKLSELKNTVKNFVINPSKSAERAVNPSKAIISLTKSDKIKFEQYISYYSEVKAGYREIWDSIAQIKYNKFMTELDTTQRKEIVKIYPFQYTEPE